MAFGEGAVSFGNIKVSTQLSLLFSFKKKKKTSAGFFFNLIFFFFFLKEQSSLIHQVVSL